MADPKHETTDDIVIRLRDNRAVYDGGSPTLESAALIIERLRATYISECVEVGYSEAEAREMLAEVEAGEDD